MKTKTVKHTVAFKATPREIYDMLMDSKKHQAFSGAKANISDKVGGKISAYGGYISGYNLALRPGKRIVQAWRGSSWAPDHYSIVIYDLKKAKGGAKLTFSHIGVPVENYASIDKGWVEAYWDPMKAAIAKAGGAKQRKRR
jgi:activator of HSP90 ATPase